MLGKLMKYDIKNMSKILVWFYVITLGLAVITRLIHFGSHIQAIHILELVFQGCVYAGIGNILVNTFVHIIKNFRTSFYKDESYLIHTLPIDKNKLLLSKYLSALIVILCSIVAIVLSLFIMFYSPELITTIHTFLNTSVPGFTIPVGVVVALIVAILFAEICCLISFAFTGVIQGHQSNDKKALNSFVCFFAYYFATMICSLIIIAIVFAITGNFSLLMAEQLTQSAFITLLITGLVCYIGYTIAFFFIARHLFNKGVNVD